MFEMVPPPIDGRTFSGSRRVRLGDCSPGGRLRLDATARYLQDLSDDDTRDAGLAQMTWVVRRTVIDVLRFPAYLEPLEMTTWCSAIGSRWAERRVDIAGAGVAGVGAAGGSISAATLWVHLDGASLRPTAPAAGFHAIFGPSAAGRSISSRLTLESTPPPEVSLTPWPLRFTDFDVMDHVNNAIAFAAIEEVLARRREVRAPLRIEVEYRSAIDRGAVLLLAEHDRNSAIGGSADGSEVCDGWLVDEAARCPVAFRLSRPALRE